MNKAFFINGGAGRVLCSIPALEHYADTHDDFVIVAEAWIELFMVSPKLRQKVLPVTNKRLFHDFLLDKEIVSPEPYRFNPYFNQKCNMIQAFDMLINNLDDIPDTKPFKLDLSKEDQIYGHNLVDQVKSNFGKKKTVVFQPFGSGARMDGKFIYDPTGRSFEVKDIFTVCEELTKHYNVILMSQIKIPTDKEMKVALPDNLDLLKWLGIINAADYFLGCDSVGQHYAHALKKPATVVIGSTFPENITYPDNKDFTVIDSGKEKRTYAPFRVTSDPSVERDNEDLMVMDDKVVSNIIKSVTDKLGKEPKKSSLSSAVGSTYQTPVTAIPGSFKKKV